MTPNYLIYLIEVPIGSSDTSISHSDLEVVSTQTHALRSKEFSENPQVGCACVLVYATGAHDANGGAVSPAGVSRGEHATAYTHNLD